MKEIELIRGLHKQLLIDGVRTTPGEIRRFLKKSTIFSIYFEDQLSGRSELRLKELADVFVVIKFGELR